MSEGQGVIVCIKDLSPDDQAKKSNESGWLARDGHIPFDGGLLEYSSRNIHLADRSISARLASFREATSTTVFFLEPRVANGSKFQHAKLGVHVVYCKHRKVHKTQPCKHVFCNSTSGKSCPMAHLMRPSPLLVVRIKRLKKSASMCNNEHCKTRICRPAMLPYTSKVLATLFCLLSVMWRHDSIHPLLWPPEVLLIKLLHSQRASLNRCRCHRLKTLIHPTRTAPTRAERTCPVTQLYWRMSPSLGA